MTRTTNLVTFRATKTYPISSCGFTIYPIATIYSKNRAAKEIYEQRCTLVSKCAKTGNYKQSKMACRGFGPRERSDWLLLAPRETERACLTRGTVWIHLALGACVACKSGVLRVASYACERPFRAPCSVKALR